MGERRDLLEGVLSPVPPIPVVDETGPLTPLDDWYTEFGRVEVLRALALIKLGTWHPPMLWRSQPPEEWRPPLPWPPTIVMCSKGETLERPSGAGTKEIDEVLQTVDEIAAQQLLVNLNDDAQGGQALGAGATAQPDVITLSDSPPKVTELSGDGAGAKDNVTEVNQGGTMKETGTKPKDTPGVRGSGLGAGVCQGALIQPSDEFLALGKKAYDVYGDYDTARMKIYSYLRMPAPEIEVLPYMNLRSGASSYFIKVLAPTCSSCNNRHAVLRHKRYLEVYPQLPFICEHGEVVQDLVVDDHIDGEPILIPDELDAFIPEDVSIDSKASITTIKINQDMEHVVAKGRAALDLMKLLESRSIMSRFDLSMHPVLQVAQVSRMKALVEKGAEQLKEDMDRIRETLWERLSVASSNSQVSN